MATDAVPPEWRSCRCSCCVERSQRIDRGRVDLGCHCDEYLAEEQCDCVGCTRDRGARRT